MATQWGDGHGRVLGNFGPKPTVEHNGTTYTFSWPGFGLMKAMEDMVKRDARRALAADREEGLLPGDLYEKKYTELNRLVNQGWFSAPHGPGFKGVYDLRSDDQIKEEREAAAKRLGVDVSDPAVAREAESLDSAKRYNTVVSMIQALLLPVHGEVPKETVAMLFAAHQEEVGGILSEMLTANLGNSGPKA